MSLIRSLDARSLTIPFKAAFSHASASRDATQTLWVEAHDAEGRTGHGEGCPRDYVTGETIESALAFVSQHDAALRAGIRDLPSLKAWVDAHRSEIDAAPAAWAAIELALLDLMAKRENRSVEALLGLSEIDGPFRYTAVIGDGPAAHFQAELARYRQAGFEDFKIKLSGDAARDAGKVAALQNAGIAPAKVRADANNLWSRADEAIAALQSLGFAFGAVEEPIKAGDIDGLAAIAHALGCGIILDESLLRSAQFDAFAHHPARWIVNLRVSKMGGLLRSLELIDRVRTLSFGIVIGAHVGETSLLSRAALTLASAARDLVLAQEGAFGTHLLARDVVEPPIMFGVGGVLKAASLPRLSGGFGLGDIDIAAFAPP